MLIRLIHFFGGGGLGVVTTLSEFMIIFMN